MATVDDEFTLKRFSTPAFESSAPKRARLDDVPKKVPLVFGRPNGAVERADASVVKGTAGSRVLFEGGAAVGVAVPANAGAPVACAPVGGAAEPQHAFRYTPPQAVSAGSKSPSPALSNRSGSNRPQPFIPGATAAPSVSPSVSPHLSRQQPVPFVPQAQSAAGASAARLSPTTPTPPSARVQPQPFVAPALPQQQSHVSHLSPQPYVPEAPRQQQSYQPQLSPPFDNRQLHMSPLQQVLPAQQCAPAKPLPNKPQPYVSPRPEQQGRVAPWAQQVQPQQQQEQQCPPFAVKTLSPEHRQPYLPQGAAYEQPPEQSLHRQLQQQSHLTPPYARPQPFVPPCPQPSVNAEPNPDNSCSHCPEGDASLFDDDALSAEAESPERAESSQQPVAAAPPEPERPAVCIFPPIQESDYEHESSHHEGSDEWVPPFSLSQAAVRPPAAAAPPVSAKPTLRPVPFVPCVAQAPMLPPPPPQEQQQQEQEQQQGHVHGQQPFNPNPPVHDFPKLSDSDYEQQDSQFPDEGASQEWMPEDSALQQQQRPQPPQAPVPFVPGEMRPHTAPAAASGVTPFVAVQSTKPVPHLSASTAKPVPFFPGHVAGPPIPQPPQPPKQQRPQTTTDPLASFSPQVQEYFEKRGISSMYDWQREVLALPSVQDGGNLVFSLPTSGGKSLVAEMLLLRAVQAGFSGVLVMPYVSLVEEKIAALGPVCSLMGADMICCAGTTSMIPVPGKRFICVATIEKAVSLMNSMHEEKRLEEFGAFVVDELHMVGEEGRGAILEMLLAKVLRQVPRCQVIGMSATIPNLPVLAKWLNAHLYESDFRPVTLTSFLVAPSTTVRSQMEVCDTAGRHVRTLAVGSQQEVARTEGAVAQLVNEVAPSGSCLIFCTTKVNCEKGCVELVKRLSPEVKNANRPHREALLREMKGCVNGTVGAKLEGCVLGGVAYHHAGLTSEERTLIEEAFKKKVLCIICCTSTLAAGVNLPARRVIIKYPFIAREFLTKSRYLQMCGRAGRAGLDATGESYLIVMSRELPKAKVLVGGAVIEPLKSQGRERAAVERVVMDAVATRSATTKEGLLSVARVQLYPHQEEVTDENVDEYLGVYDTVLSELMAARMVAARYEEPKGSQSQSFTTEAATQGDAPREGEDPAFLEVTPFGLSAFKSGFTTEEALTLKKELNTLRCDGVILADDLHLLYYLTPIKDMWQWNVDWQTYVNVLSVLDNPVKQKIAKRIGLCESFIVKQAVQSAYVANKKDHDEFVCRRFWCALILSDLLAETPLDKVEMRYKAERVCKDWVPACVEHRHESFARTHTRTHRGGYKPFRPAALRSAR